MEKNYGLVSVIMPCYDGEKYIAVAIESVINQTYHDWELLIVDDCSTDRSSSIIVGYAAQDYRIRCFKTQSPSGSPCLPRNMGIEASKGRFIAFLDSDDCWLPNKLEQQLPLFEEFNVGVVYSDYEKMSENGERNQRIVRAPARVNYRQLLLGNVIGCLTAVYDTAKVGKVYFENHSHEDYILWLSILKQGYVARNSGKVSACYRVREHSVSSNKWKALSWQWDIYRNVEKIGFLKAAYCFVHYAYKAFRKAMT